MLGNQAAERYREDEPGTVSARVDANGRYDAANVALLSMAGIWAVAVLDAAFTGRDAVEVDRTRLELQPTGVAWRF